MNQPYVTPDQLADPKVKVFIPVQIQTPQGFSEALLKVEDLPAAIITRTEVSARLAFAGFRFVNESGKLMLELPTGSLSLNPTEVTTPSYS